MTDRAQVEFLAALVRAPSDNPPGDSAAPAELTARLLEDLGFVVERHGVPAARAVAQGLVSVTNLIVRQRYGEGPVIALNAHGDVVPPGEGWSVDPYGAVVQDGWMYGRGVAVSKSDIATYAFAMLALRQARLRGSIELHVTYDEETGGELGPAFLLAEGLSRPDYAICAGFSYAVVTAHNGCLHLEVELRGKSAHAAKPETGADALVAATAVLASIYDMRAELARRVSATPGIGAASITVGLINGGINTNVVPDRVSLRLDRRILPEEDAGEVEAVLRARIAGVVAGQEGITLRIERILLARPLVPLPGAERLAAVIAGHASAEFGEAITAVGSPLYTDARHYAAAGIPVVLYGAGPRSIELANAHRADERLALADLTRATEVLARSLADLLAA